MSAAQRVLDQVQSLARIEALEADPRAYARELEVAPADTIAALEERDRLLASALQQVEAMIARAMKIRLEHALADDRSIGAPTRNVFATTVVRYEADLGTLGERARDAAARGGAHDPDGVANRVVDAASSVLALREAVRAGVLELIGELAKASIPEADRHARDRQLDDPVRKRWSAVRRDLEMIAGDPRRILAAPMPDRVKAWPEQLDEPDPGREVTFADMIELD